MLRLEDQGAPSSAKNSSSLCVATCRMCFYTPQIFKASASRRGLDASRVSFFSPPWTRGTNSRSDHTRAADHRYVKEGTNPMGRTLILTRGEAGVSVPGAWWFSSDPATLSRHIESIYISSLTSYLNLVSPLSVCSSSSDGWISLCRMLGGRLLTCCCVVCGVLCARTKFNVRCSCS